MCPAITCWSFGTPSLAIAASIGWPTNDAIPCSILSPAITLAARLHGVRQGKCQRDNDPHGLKPLSPRYYTPALAAVIWFGREHLTRRLTAANDRRECR